MKNISPNWIASFAVALLLAAPLVAHATVVTFEDVSNHSSAPFSSGGLDFTGGTTYVWNGPGYAADNGTLNLISGFSNSFTITKTGGGLFSIDQFDAGLSWYTTLQSLDVTVGANVITLDPTFQTFLFSNLVNLTSLTVSFAPSDGYMSFDNIVWHEGSQVPEPETLLLLALGLVGIAASRRKTA